MNRLASTVLFILLCLVPGHAELGKCGCDASRPETMAVRECSLCAAAESQNSPGEFAVIRDASPNKPNRWLAIPRFHTSQPEELAGMTQEQRTAYWTVAIAKARELWGGSWALAVNATELRTQCHMHIHIGRLRQDAEDANYRLVKTPDEIPLPRAADGMWVHPVDGGLHVHWGNPAPELLLYR